MRSTSALTLFSSLLPCLLAGALTSCAKKAAEESTAAPVETKRVFACAASTATFTGTPWVPSTAGIGASNHLDSSVAVTMTEQVSATAPVTAVNGALSSTVSFSFTVPAGMGPSGSLQLDAVPALIDASITAAQARVYPVLVELQDPSGRYFVRLSGCNSGLYTCSGVNCSAVTACAPEAGGAFLGDSAVLRRRQWDTRQAVLSLHEGSVNLFPTCGWTEATTTGPGLTCPFHPTSDSLLQGGELRPGTWTAKYALVSQFIATANGGAPFSQYKSAVKLVVTTKKDHDQQAGGKKGAMDLNVVLVGTQNIRDSRTAKGKQNLDALLAHVANQLGQTSTGIQIGTVKVFEMTCDRGGDYYSDMTTEEVPELIALGSDMIGSAYDAKAVNVFLTSSFSAGSSAVLGVSGGIPGSALAGTGSNGVVFSTFDELATFNPLCNGTGACTSQQAAFIDMGATISHEIGHFLGLNHPTERDALGHDYIADTPICTRTDSIDPDGTGPMPASSVITRSSCQADTNAHPTQGGTCAALCPHVPGLTVFCPAVEACSFNHLMWYTSKSFGTGGVMDGVLLSPHSGTLLNYSPYVR